MSLNETELRGPDGQCVYGTNPDGSCKPKSEARQVEDTTTLVDDHSHTVVFPDTAEQAGTVTTSVTNGHAHTIQHPAYEEGQSFEYQTSVADEHSHAGRKGNAPAQRPDDVNTVREATGNVETRCIPVELRTVQTADGKTKVTGYAIVFNSKSVNLGGFREIIRPSAFRRVLSSDQDIVSFANHAPNRLLGRRSNNTLKLTSDEKGVFMEATPPDTQASRDTITEIDGGYMTGMSFQFQNTPGTDKFTREPDGTVLREVNDANLVELGPVTFPAYPETTVTVSAEARSAVAALQREEVRSEDTPEASGEAGAPAVEPKTNKVEVDYQQILDVEAIALNLPIEE